MKIEKMLKTISSELLPLSNTKQVESRLPLEYEEVKYLNFDEALDSIAGDEEKEEISETDEEQSYDVESQELIDELKKDIEGLF
jgi:hypothetical protein